VGTAVIGGVFTLAGLAAAPAHAWTSDSDTSVYSSTDSGGSSPSYGSYNAVDGNGI
jgi:hypothetical protein